MLKIESIEYLFKVQNLLEKIGNNNFMKDFGLTVSLYRILKILEYHSSELGKIEILNIKKFSNESPASLTQKIQKLEKLNLIKRSLNKKDKRRWFFELTNDGVEIIKNINSKMLELENELFYNISNDEKEIFINILKKQEKNLLEII